MAPSTSNSYSKFEKKKNTYITYFWHVCDVLRSVLFGGVT